MVLSFLSFYLFGKLLISSLDLKESLSEQSILGCRFFPFISWNISCHCLLACRDSVEKSADKLMGTPLYVICHFPLVVFLIFYLCLLIFASLITMCLSVFLFGFILPGTLLPGLDYFLSHVQKVFSYYFFKYFLRSFLSSFLLWDSYNANVSAFKVVSEDC